MKEFAGSVFYDNEFVEGTLILQGSMIKGIKISGDQDLKDIRKTYIIPGLIDVHIHGHSSFDFSDTDLDGLKVVSKNLAQKGVSSFLPTITTSSIDKTKSAVRLISKNKDLPGGKPLGIFLEGPFLNPEKAGAQDEDEILPLDIAYLEDLQNLAGGFIKKICIGPELEGVEDFVKACEGLGIQVGLGHSNASYEEAMEAVGFGAEIFIHGFNAMSPLHHRRPGMVGAMMDSDTYAELILDGHHLAYPLGRILAKLKGDKLILVSDSTSATGMEDGTYKLGARDVVKKGNGMETLDGKIAGSATNLIDCLKNAVENKVVGLEDAIKSVTFNPAKSLALEDEVGILYKGAVGNFIILDEDLNVEGVYIEGEKFS